MPVSTEASRLASEIVIKIPSLVEKLQKYERETWTCSMRCDALEREMNLTRNRVEAEKRERIRMQRGLGMEVNALPATVTTKKRTRERKHIQVSPCTNEPLPVFAPAEEDEVALLLTPDSDVEVDESSASIEPGPSRQMKRRRTEGK